MSARFIDLNDSDKIIESKRIQDEEVTRLTSELDDAKAKLATAEATITDLQTRLAKAEEDILTKADKA